MRCSHPACTGTHNNNVPAAKRCPAALERKNAYHREKYRSNPEYRDRRRKTNREWRPNLSAHDRARDALIQRRRVALSRRKPSTDSSEQFLALLQRALPEEADQDGQVPDKRLH